jgi:hypothetical protein
MTVLDLTYDYSRLSLTDLLQARDTYHYHLLSKANVVGTAVGLYLIRKDEEWPQRKGEGRKPRLKKTYARTLTNSEVRDYSWPCVIVFVRNWEDEKAFGPGGRFAPHLIVPKTLYMPDGRAVPVCVVETKEGPPVDTLAREGVAIRPSHMFGGGLPISVDVQGSTHVATAGCMVSDGHLAYVLTARHVCGEAGTVVSSNLREGRVRIGESSAKLLTRLPFSKVYPDFPGRRSYVSLDVGLIRVDDTDRWTSNTYGLPPVGSLADVHERNLSLRLIDEPVVGYGAASGLLKGTIKALFYRHRSVGGYDYVGDFLISPGEDNQTRPGDSGMVWHLDVTEDKPDQPAAPLVERDLRPLALEWGGQIFDEAGRRSTFAVATSLSNVCKLLDVELVTDLSRGVAGYWGRTGHYSIAAFAISAIGDGRLKGFLNKNAELLSFELSDIAQRDFDKSVGKLSAANEFVPLADVPDEIWKKLPFGKQAREGGRDTHGGGHGSDGPEHPNHYADIDAPFGQNGETWRAMCIADPGTNITPEAWQRYYEEMAQRAAATGNNDEASQYRSPLKQGILPFRIWQFFDAMVGFVKAGDVEGYVTAAGTLAHYVGDAAQPLHGSIFADGDTSRKATRFHPETGETEEVDFGDGIHSAYETVMVSKKALDLLQMIQAKMPVGGHGLPLPRTGQEVATATIRLMDAVASLLRPIDLIETYEAAGAGTRNATINALWDDYGDETAGVMALGARYLAVIWEAAWVEGGGAGIPASKLKAQERSNIRKRYIDKEFVPSVTLEDIAGLLK